MASARLESYGLSAPAKVGEDLISLSTKEERCRYVRSTSVRSSVEPRWCGCCEGDISPAARSRLRARRVKLTLRPSKLAQSVWSAQGLRSWLEHSASGALSRIKHDSSTSPLRLHNSRVQPTHGPTLFLWHVGRRARRSIRGSVYIARMRARQYEHGGDKCASLFSRGCLYARETSLYTGRVQGEESAIRIDLVPARDVPAENLGLEPVGGDEDTVPEREQLRDVSRTPEAAPRNGTNQR